MTDKITKRLSLAYWPNPEKNESASKSGDAAVDKLTIAELVQFYSECRVGPTYCMVTQRVREQLSKLPPHIEDKKTRALAAIDAARQALLSLNTILD